MKKILITIICVFIALVFIGATVFPESNLRGTILGIKKDYSAVINTFEFVANIALKLTPESNDPYNTIDALSSMKNVYLSSLSSYISNFITTNDLYNKCSNQSLSIYTMKLNIHEEHKVCVFYCKNVWDLEFFDSFEIPESEDVYSVNLKIYYCALCNKIVAMSGFFEMPDKPFGVMYAPYTIYTCEELKDEPLIPWWKDVTSSGSFDWQVVKNYSS